MKTDQVQELLYQALETEMGGQKIYQAAVRAAVNADVMKEWQKYLEETVDHERILREVFDRLGLDPGIETPGRKVLRDKAEGLVRAIESAMAFDKLSAQLVAAESIVEAETKDHQNWELIGMVAQTAKSKMKQALQEAYDQVEEQEDEHLYHTMGWCRELWLASLGLPAVLPPPEEEKSVKTAIGAARAKNARGDMVNGSNGSKSGGAKASASKASAAKSKSSSAKASASKSKSNGAKASASKSKSGSASASTSKSKAASGRSR